MKTNLEDVPDLLDEVERVALSYGVDQDHAICPAQALCRGQVLDAAGAEVADLEDDGVTVHQDLVLVPGV